MVTTGEVKKYLDRFEVTAEMLQNVVAVAMSRGADYTDLYFEHKMSGSIGLEDGKVNRAFSNVDFGCGIRVLKGDQTGFAYTETLDERDLLNAASLASNIAGENRPFTRKIPYEIKPASRYRLKHEWEQVSVREKVPFLEKINEKIFGMDSHVIRVNASVADETGYMLYFDSDGRLTYDYRPLASFRISCVMEKNGRVENNSVSRSFRTGFEWLTEELLDELAKDVVDKTRFLFDASRPLAGEMPVVMAAGGSGILLHEAIGHTFEADFNRKGTSIFSDKMGKKIARDFIQIIDDGTLENNRGSLNIDDEGNEVKKTYLVKDGMLNSYIHDKISAAHYGVETTGNGRRESFRSIPLPRMRSTYMENGPHTREEIIRSVDQGIFVDNFSNGQVQIGAGDFTFFVKSGYLIEKGKLTRPVKDINIIGNGPQALADISMVANDFLMDNSTWTCGKNGQSVPVTCGLPTVRVDKLTVGGTNA